MFDACVAGAENVIARWNVASVVGEFGCPSDEQIRDECHRVWIDEFEPRGWSWCHWNFNPDCRNPDGDDEWCGEKYSVAFTPDGSRVERTAAYRALLRPFIRRCGGPLLSVSLSNNTFGAP